MYVDEGLAWNAQYSDDLDEGVTRRLKSINGVSILAQKNDSLVVKSSPSLAER